MTTMKSPNKYFVSCLLTMFLGAGAKASVAPDNNNFYNLRFKSLEGEEFPEDAFIGKVVLVVNTASKCGYTPQYAGLQELYEKYRDEGFVVLAIPSGDFWRQEFTKSSQVRQFTDEKFKISFPLADISHVKGESRHPFFDLVEDKLGYFALPWWNFHKYLVNREGELIASFSTRTSPLDEKVIRQIESALADK